ASVAIINEKLANHLFPDEDPLGKRVIRGKDAAPREIVGIVADVKHLGLNSQALDELYLPYTQTPWPSMTLVVQTHFDPAIFVLPAQKEVSKIDSDQPVFKVRAMQEVV